MIKWNQISKPVIFITLLMLGVVSYAQDEKLYRAQMLLDTKVPANIDQAMLTIDSVVQHPKTKIDFIAWTTRGFIYYEVYKRTDKYVLNSKLRDTVISSIKTSNSLKPDSVYKKYNQRLINAMAGNYFNISIKLLQDSVNYDRSLIAYNRYKALYKLIDPNETFKSNDVKYYLGVSTTYNEKYTKDSSEKTIEVSRMAYMHVLELEPENNSANLGLGLLHYNQAVTLSRQLEYGAELDQIEVVQDNMVKLAKQSEQFVLKVYNNDKKNPRAVEALYYIYRMLMDKTKHDDFKKKCTELGIMVNEEKPADGKGK